MQIVTAASHNPPAKYYFFNAFMESIRRFGLDPIILGWGEPWKGLGSKPRMLQQAIESKQITHKHIIFCDAWDVLFQSDPQTQEPYLSDAIVFNAEKNCFPDPKLADSFPETKTPYRYLNSGFSIGPTDLYLQALKEMKAAEIPDDHMEGEIKIEPNDQLYWQRQYLFGNTPIRLDATCDYCQTLAGVTEDELLFDNGVIRNKETDRTPFCFHVNGRKEEWKPILCNYLKLPQ